MQITFYNLKSTPMDRALPNLLQKALDTGMSASLIVPKGMVDTYSHMLWQGGGCDSFLAHDVGGDGSCLAPLHIVDCPSTARQVRFFVDCLDVDGLTDATSVYFIFSSNDMQVVHNARLAWRTLQDMNSHNLVYYQQDENGKWIKKG